MPHVDPANPLAEVLRACLFLTTGDYPAQGLINEMQGAGARNGCMQCTLQGEYAHSISRMTYANYRRHLPAGHELRTDNRWSEHETQGPPVKKTRDMVLQYAELSENFAGNEQDKAHPKGLTGVRGTSELIYAPGAGPRGLHDPTTLSPKNLVHIFKQIFSHVMQCYKKNRIPRVIRYTHKPAI